ncbi:LacI family DNA-binding transcriptional regulator [Roseomonas haemaphysalidis]|uniref:LacI family DNA-binding transcriptional regulator n=1 Tax=Roseomonas haemaphysalidis TaxID=2768162 RepID=A0ABS3KNG8_9PROT|nr:LacI family DNA-binding transcriptional regulator [Roseomonas haemaphysalidis]MBO1078545.1 LacI family DNA-binding transcriptional regulator [Roseomonas haemaphysalidis]
MSKPPAAPPRRPERAATAHDVARRAGVSQSAVSRAFTPGASVSAATRARVEEAAAALGYRPNLIARSLITRRSSIVGVAVAYLDNPFYAALLDALSVALEATGHRVLLFTARPGANTDPILEEVLRYRVDALVLASVGLSSRFARECRQAGVPVVLVNRRSEDDGAACITGDNAGGAALIARFLAAGGHRRPAFLAGLEDASTSREREAGFATELAALGFGPPLRAVGHYDFGRAEAATRVLLSAAAPPDALFCANDHMGFAALGVARREFGGLPVSVVGFDDAGPAGWAALGLTTYSQPLRPMVDRVVTALMRQMLAPDEAPLRETVPGALLLRGSAREPHDGVSLQDGERVWRG